MEIFRSLGLMAEAPGAALERAAAVLGMGVPPTVFEYTDVFEFQLYPYASVYLGAEGMMGGEARDRIAGFWRVLAETPPSEPDHLTVLLAAYAELAEREADAGDDETSSRWRHARSAFLWEHLLSWLPVFLEKVGEMELEFYDRWSELVSVALVEEAANLTLPDQLPLHLREARPLGTLEDASGDEFLKAITTPVRTGMILVRKDLERCARSLGLGLRKGERRYALKSLLGQAPRETLEFLAGEADGWAERHGKRIAVSRAGAAGAVGLISDFWRERAETTSVLLRESAASLSSDVESTT